MLSRISERDGTYARLYASDPAAMSFSVRMKSQNSSRHSVSLFDWYALSTPSMAMAVNAIPVVTASLYATAVYIDGCTFVILLIAFAYFTDSGMGFIIAACHSLILGIFSKLKLPLSDKKSTNARIIVLYVASHHVGIILDCCKIKITMVQNGVWVQCSSHTARA